MNDDVAQQLAESLRALQETNTALLQNSMISNEINKKLAAAQGIQLNSIKGLDKDFSTVGSKVKEQSAIYQANQKAANDYAAAMGNLTNAAASFTVGLKSAGTALLTTEKSFAKYNTALSSAGDAALSLGKSFGLLGTILGGIVKVGTKVMEMATEQADATLKATDQLSGLGGAGALTANQVLDMGHRAGLTSKNLEVLTKAASKAGSGMAGLGVTVGDGIKAFGDMTAVSSGTRQAFQRLGVSQEKLMEQQADYVKLQEMSGKSLIGQAKDGKTLQKQSLEYAENLARLSALTGKSADKLQEEQSAAQLEYEEIVATRIEDDKIRQLKAEGRAQEAKGLEDEQKARKAYINQVTVQLGKEEGLKVAKVARSGSFDSSTASLANLGITAEGIRAGYQGKTEKEAQEGATKFTQGFDEKQSKMLSNLGTSLQYGGEQLGKQFSLSKESLQERGKFQGRDETAAAKEARARTQGAAAGSPAAGGVAALDPAQIARNKLTETEIEAQVVVDKLVASLNPLLNGFNGATIAATGLAAAAAAAALALGVMAGRSALGGLKSLGGGAGKEVSKNAGKVAERLRDPKTGRFVKAATETATKEVGTLGKMAGFAGKATKVLGPAGAVIAGGMALKEGYDKFKDIDELQKTGDISKGDATVRKSEAVGSGVGQAAGGAGGAMAGAAAGAAIGSVVPVVGTVIGGLLGAAVGGWLGSKGGEVVGEKVGKVTGEALKGSDTKADKEAAAKKVEETQKDATRTTAKLDVANNTLSKTLLLTNKALDNLTESLDDLANIQSMDKQGGTAKEKQERLEAIFNRLGARTASGPVGGSTPQTSTAGNGPSVTAKSVPSASRGVGSSTPGAAPSGGSAQSSADQLKNAGLVLKRGDVQKEGAELDPKLIEIAKQIQASVPGFVQFTGFNDQFHSENAPGSLHAKGKAFDFVVNKKPSKEEGQKIKEIMKQLGVDYAIDEYNSPSAQATGGHFHGQLKAYDGGVFEGPRSGYDVELHGREAIVPLPNPDSIIKVEEPEAQKSPLSTAMAQKTETTASSNSDTMKEIMVPMFDMLSEKLDTMINKLSDSNDIQGKIYKVSAV